MWKLTRVLFAAVVFLAVAGALVLAGHAWLDHHLLPTVETPVNIVEK